MLLNLNVILFVSAFGFISAAIIYTLFTNTERVTKIKLPKNQLALWFIVLPLTAFTGPYWVVIESQRGLSDGRFSIPLYSVGLIIAGIWSFCAGVFVVEFLHLLNLV